jgi:hypothetical protein
MQYANKKLIAPMQSSTKPFINPKHNRHATKPRLNARRN